MNLNRKEDLQKAVAIVVSIGMADVSTTRIRTGAEIIAYLKVRHGLTGWRKLHESGLKRVYTMAYDTKRASNRDLRRMMHENAQRVL